MSRLFRSSGNERGSVFVVAPAGDIVGVFRYTLITPDVSCGVV